jgi:regulator of PEP synthase PpsR (kinase-PPPase family)
LVPGHPVPDELFNAHESLVVGLTTSPERLIQIRRNRLRSMNEDSETDYVDATVVRNEVNEAKRLFETRKWPVIDVSRRSIEETAAEVLALHRERAGLD